MTESTYHTCSKCGRAYTRAQWDAVPPKGTVAYDEEDVLDFRDCDCGGTMAHNVATDTVRRSPAPCPACRGLRYAWTVPAPMLTPQLSHFQRKRCERCAGSGVAEPEPPAADFPTELPLPRTMRASDWYHNVSGTVAPPCWRCGVDRLVDGFECGAAPCPACFHRCDAWEQRAIERRADTVTPARYVLRGGERVSVGEP